MKITSTFITGFFLICLGLISCSRSMNKTSAEFNHKPTEDKIAEIEKDTLGYGKSFNEDNEPLGNPPERLISKVNFFIENSGSMKGFVTGSTTYIDVLTDLANHPRLAEERTNSFFYLTSGIQGPVRVIKLNNELIPSRFNQRHSDLNKLFNNALDSTYNNSISILISDGIYDMCPDPTPLNKLSTLGHELRSIFIQKIDKQNIQTILIKCKSRFDGLYSPGNCCTSYRINEDRPFYIWIFGQTDILKNYFPDDYITSLEGYVSSARFFKYDSSQISFKPVSHKRIGSYRPSMNNDNALERVRAGASGMFQFSIAVDFSSLPLNDEYIRDIKNYSCSNGYSVVAIDSPTAIAKLALPNLTHLIVVKKSVNPVGALSVSLLNNSFKWIDDTNIDNDCNIRGQNDQTFGFRILNEGIIDAYQHFIKSKEIVSFKITLNY